MPAAVAIPAALGVASLGGSLINGAANRSASEDEANQQRKINAANKSNQLDLLHQLQAPEVSPLIQRRLQALNLESQNTSLSQDPLFQGQRARLLQGGAKELSSIQNLQRANNINGGGFRNVGSLQDVEDRLSAGLADLGQKQITSREQKRTEAATGEQALMDAQNEFNNARIKAAIAIEGGDAQAATAALQQASQARQAMAAQQQALFGNLLGVGGTIAGGALQAQANADLLKQLQGGAAGGGFGGATGATDFSGFGNIA